MGQLAGRLKEILRAHCIDPHVYRDDLDAIRDLEGHDPKRAHALFTDVRRRVLELRLRDTLHRLRAHPFLQGVPDLDPEPIPDKELEQLLRQADRRADAADRLHEALEEARALATDLHERNLALPLARFATIPYDDLEAHADAAEHLRRQAAREHRIQTRLRAAQQRARKLQPRRVDLPDATAATTPDPAEADALLEQAEKNLATAEAINTAHTHVLRELRNPALRHHHRDETRRLRRQADDAAQHPDPEQALTRLQKLTRQAHALREDAAHRAQQAARARRTGRAPPPRTTRSTDPQDGYG